MTALTDQLRIAFDQGKKIRENELLIAQNNSQGELFPEEIPDLPVTPDTRLGDFQEQGGWMDKDKPFRDLNPRRKGYVPPRTRWSEENKKRKAQDAQKQSILEKWRRDNGLDPDGNAFPPGWNLQIKGDMPADVNTPWLPGGQSTEGIPNVENPKLKEVLKKRKGIKQQNPGLDIPDFLKNIDIKPRDLLKILQLIHAAGGALLAPQLQIGQAGGDGTQIADAQGLTDTLAPHQNPRNGSLKGSSLSDEEKIQLLIRGVVAHKA